MSFLDVAYKAILDGPSNSEIVIDIDDDGIKEVIVANYPNTYILKFDEELNLKKKIKIARYYGSLIGTLDVDGDGKKEIVFQNSVSGTGIIDGDGQIEIYKVGPTKEGPNIGTKLERITFPGQKVKYVMVTLDIDNDGKEELNFLKKDLQ